MKALRALLAVIAVVCIGVALSYPIRYFVAARSNNAELESLSAMRERARGGVSAAPDEGLDLDWDAPEGDYPDAPDSTPAPNEIETTPPVDAPEGENAPADASSAVNAPATADAQADAAPSEDASVPALTGDASAHAPERPGETDLSHGISAQTPPPEADAVEGAHSTAAPEGAAQTADVKATPAGEGIPTEIPADPVTEAPVDSATEPPAGDATDAPAENAATDAPVIWGTLPPKASDAPEDDAPEASQSPDGASPTPGEGFGGDVPEASPSPDDGLLPEATPDDAPPMTDLDFLLDDAPDLHPQATARASRASAPTPAPTATPVPSPTPDRHIHVGPMPYPYKEKILLDERLMLPELREIYLLNPDLVGWITIPGTVVDYPVVQTEDSEYYLSHDFYGKENANGQIILDTKCDPYTPSYNLVISGHHMLNGSMFGSLTDYRSENYWKKHKLLEFDTLMSRKQYVIFAAFYSADYDEDEEGFRYNADIEYRKDAEQWLGEIRANQLYDTGIEVDFGDEFITLTTCTKARRKDGRFVVVCRRIRKGETFE